MAATAVRKIEKFCSNSSDKTTTSRITIFIEHSVPSPPDSRGYGLNIGESINNYLDDLKSDGYSDRYSAYIEPITSAEFEAGFKDTCSG